MKDPDVDLYKLILEIRATAEDLNAISLSVNEAAGITAAERTVLEALFGRDERTVPQIAKAKHVSRQHVQLLVDGLSAKNLVRHADNPGHKRSKLILITETGHAFLTRSRGGYIEV